MYTTTFYSYKGGVGRSMALVNAGVELARRDRRVLLVDFDLEAPGLDTFDIFESKQPRLGIVDYVHKYLESGEADDLEKYVHPCYVDAIGKQIWIMPAGGSKPDYASRFQHIDWGELYANQNGYLLMENLKQQWEDTVHPDYVLIDSRTGLTDVGGICTRQLPDAVAIFYFPNEQNLQGAGKVVREIRSESEGPRKKDIVLHFVMSNVPDLDDEHQILEKKIGEFKRQFELQAEPLVVHRYDSLSLLNQAIFASDRPKSRLAEEYREIVDEIVNANMGDREGALKLLNRLERRTRRERWDAWGSQEINSKLKDIEERHGGDSEILFQLGSHYHREQELERAASLYQRAIDLDYANPEVFLDRARAMADLGYTEEANRDAFRALRSSELSVPSIRRALKLVDTPELASVVDSNAVKALDSEQRIRLASDTYFESESMRNIGLQLIPNLEDLSLLSVSDTSILDELGLMYISSSQFKLAEELFTKSQDKTPDIASLFNLAIATWGETGEYKPWTFKKVIDMHEGSDNEESPTLEDANYFQCIALAYTCTGDKDKSTSFLDQAQEAAPIYDRTFSCWRYLYVNNREFLEDIGEMRKFVDGDRSISPTFLAKASEED